MNNDKEEKQKKLEEERKQKEQEDKNNVEEVKKIIEEQKDAFGSFHTQNEFVDQINVYAKDKNINGLILQNNEDKDKKLIVDTDGGKNNKIKPTVRITKIWDSVRHCIERCCYNKILYWWRLTKGSN
ncbi:hypothetical protein HYE36_05205 [Mycoplasmopsis bovis]|nr:hypothetical protein [Mycoplasmopsis bovis]WHL49346.1 hypothetical protein HYE36_05205 [Mycoplasmopsis bovis]